MSGSPKRTSVNAGEERRRQAELERAARERRRREQERRAKAAAVATAQQRARGRAAEMNQRLTRLRSEAEAVDASLLPAVDRLLADVAARGRAIDAAQDLDAVNDAVRAIESVDRSVADIRTKVLARQRRDVIERIDALVAMLDEVGLAQRMEHDAAGADEVDHLLDQARRRVTTDPGGSARRVDELAARVSRHLEAVLARRAELNEQRANATEAVAELRQRMAVLDADAHAVGVDFAAGDGARAWVDHLAVLLEAGQSAQVLEAAPGVAGQITALESTLDGSIQGLIERRALLASIVSALPDLGYDVDTSSLEETADGALALRAFRADDEGLSVLVQAGTAGQAEVFYTTDSMRHEAGGDGEPGRACGSLIDVIEALREQANADGFEVGAIRWDGDELRPPPKMHKPLPQGQARQVGGRP